METAEIIKRMDESAALIAERDAEIARLKSALADAQRIISIAAAQIARMQIDRGDEISVTLQ